MDAIHVFWQCPQCGHEFEVTAAMAQVPCSECGALLAWEEGFETARVEYETHRPQPRSYIDQIHDMINMVIGSGNRLLEPSIQLFEKATQEKALDPELQMLKAVHHLAHHPQPLLARALMYYHIPPTTRPVYLGNMRSLHNRYVDPYKNVPMRTYLQRLLRRTDALGNPDPSAFWGFTTPFAAALQYMTPDKEAACMHVLKMVDPYLRTFVEHPLPHEHKQDNALVAGRSDVRAAVLFYESGRNDPRLQATEGLEELTALPFNARHYFLPVVEKIMDQPNAGPFVEVLHDTLITPYKDMPGIKQQPVT